MLAFLRLVPTWVWLGIALAALQAYALSTAYMAGSDSRDKEVAALKGQLADAMAANSTNEVAIASLQNANRELAAAIKVELADAERAAAAVIEERDRARQELARERNLRQKLYRENQDAKRWADTAVPRAVFDSLHHAGTRSD